MNAKRWRILILLPWLALPLMLGCYAVLWPRLPAELAVKFDWSGAPADTLGRTQSLLLDTAILLFVLGQFTLRLWGADGRDMKAVVVTYYVAIIFITTVFLAILKYNL
ncbi:MAG TPA: hypothetical protein VF527_01055 [Pyrinomonadaceae bacterium]|jgi:hypothetical protein